MGALLGRPYNSPVTRGSCMDNTVKTLEQQESSATWASDKSFCSEALGGAAEQNLDEQRAGETPLTGEEHLSIGGG